MELKFILNGKPVVCDTAPDTVLLDLLRARGLHSVRRGCETACCGLCSVWLDERPVLSCALPALRAGGRRVTTLEGVREKAEVLAGYLADEGAEQCGFCSPGLVMTVLAMKRELSHPTDDEIRHYLAGNLCRCTGYISQHRAIRKYLEEAGA